MPKKTPPSVSAKIVALRAQGMSMEQIGEHVGMSHNGVRKVLNRIKDDKPEKEPAPCGTIGAAKRHRANKEVVCEKCLAAERKKWAAKYTQEVKEEFPLGTYVYAIGRSDDFYGKVIGYVHPTKDAPAKTVRLLVRSTKNTGCIVDRLLYAKQVAKKRPWERIKKEPKEERSAEPNRTEGRPVEVQGLRGTLSGTEPGAGLREKTCVIGATSISVGGINIYPDDGIERNHIVYWGERRMKEALDAIGRDREESFVTIKEEEDTDGGK